MKLTVRQNDQLLPFLLKNVPGGNRTRIKQLLTHKCVSVNSRVTTRHDHVLLPGDKLVIQTSQKPVVRQQFLKSLLKIIYEDDHLLVIDKPAGLLTISTETVQRDTAYHQVNHYLNAAHARKVKRIFVVHRLDRETSGLLVFAKTHDDKVYLQENWQRFEKRYYALVEGTPAQESGTLESMLRENKYMNVYSLKPGENAPDAKKAVTHYRVQRTGAAHALLDVTLETGRKHQIRVHLSDLGHPVAGDERYGAKTDPAGRLGLHCYSLSLIHPVSRKPLRFQIKCPDSFSRALKTV